MWAWLRCCFGGAEEEDEDERAPLLAGLSAQRNFPPPSHVLQRPNNLSRGPTLAPHERMHGYTHTHSRTNSQQSFASPPKTAGFVATTPSPAKSARSDQSQGSGTGSSPKRTIRSAPTLPLVPTHRHLRSVGSPIKGEGIGGVDRKGKGKEGWQGVSEGQRVEGVESSMNALRISPSSFVRPSFKLPAVPETLPSQHQNLKQSHTLSRGQGIFSQRRLLLEGPSTVPNSPSPGLPGVLPAHHRPPLRDTVTAPSTAQIFQTATVGASRPSTRVGALSNWPSLGDLRRRLASPPLDSQATNTVTGTSTSTSSSPAKPSTPTLPTLHNIAGPFRALVPPLSPPLFGRSVSEPQHLHLHRRLSSGSFAQMIASASQHGSQAQGVLRNSTSREDIRPPEIEGFAAHQLPQGRNTDPRSVMIARGRPRISTVISNSSGGWMGMAAEASAVAGVNVGVARDRERSESFSRPRSRRGTGSSTRGRPSRPSSTSQSRNASNLSLTVVRTTSEEGSAAKTRQRDGSVGRGYPGVAGQGRRGRSPGPSRLGSRNVSTESLWQFDGDQSSIIGRDDGLAPPSAHGLLIHRPSGERLSAIAQSGFSHDTPPRTKGDRPRHSPSPTASKTKGEGGSKTSTMQSRPPRPRINDAGYEHGSDIDTDSPPTSASSGSQQQQQHRQHTQMEGGQGNDHRTSTGEAEVGVNLEVPGSPGLQMAAKGKRSTRSVRSGKSVKSVKSGRSARSGESGGAAAPEAGAAQAE